MIQYKKVLIIQFLLLFSSFLFSQMSLAGVSQEESSITGALIIKSFNSLTPETKVIYKDAVDSFSMKTWVFINSYQAALVGGGAALVPGIHVVLMAGDLAILMSRMARSSLGVGAIIGKDERCGRNIINLTDFVAILGLWSNSENTRIALNRYKIKIRNRIKINGKNLAKLTVRARTAIMNKVIQSELKTVGVLFGKKMGVKLSKKVAVKFSAKLAVKFGIGFIPAVGVVVSSGINYYFVDDISSAAEEFYNVKTLGC